MDLEQSRLQSRQPEQATKVRKHGPRTAGSKNQGTTSPACRTKERQAQPVEPRNDKPSDLNQVTADQRAGPNNDTQVIKGREARNQQRPGRGAVGADTSDPSLSHRRLTSESPRAVRRGITRPEAEARLAPIRVDPSLSHRRLTSESPRAWDEETTRPEAEARLAPIYEEPSLTHRLLTSESPRAWDEETTRPEAEARLAPIHEEPSVTHRLPPSESPRVVRRGINNDPTRGAVGADMSDPSMSYRPLP